MSDYNVIKRWTYHTGYGTSEKVCQVYKHEYIAATVIGDECPFRILYVFWRASAVFTQCLHLIAGIMVPEFPNRWARTTRFNTWNGISKTFRSLFEVLPPFDEGSEPSSYLENLAIGVVEEDFVSLANTLHPRNWPHPFWWMQVIHASDSKKTLLDSSTVPSWLSRTV